MKHMIANVSTLGIYRVRAFFRRWVIASGILTMYGLRVLEARHHQRERYSLNGPKTNKYFV